MNAHYRQPRRTIGAHKRRAGAAKTSIVLSNRVLTALRTSVKDAESFSRACAEVVGNTQRLLCLAGRLHHLFSFFRLAKRLCSSAGRASENTTIKNAGTPADGYAEGRRFDPCQRLKILFFELYEVRQNRGSRQKSSGLPFYTQESSSDGGDSVLNWIVTMNANNGRNAVTSGT